MAVTRAGIKLFILTSQNIASFEMINILVQAIEPMKNLVYNHPAPFIAKIHRNHQVEMWRSYEDLMSELNSETEWLWKTPAAENAHAVVITSSKCSSIIDVFVVGHDQASKPIFQLVAPSR